MFCFSSFPSSPSPEVRKEGERQKVKQEDEREKQPNLPPSFYGDCPLLSTLFILLHLREHILFSSPLSVIASRLVERQKKKLVILTESTHKKRRVSLLCMRVNAGGEIQQVKGGGGRWKERTSAGVTDKTPL